MGSDSDLATMRAAAEALEGLGVSTEVTVVSAHRTPERMVAYARSAHTRGIQARARSPARTHWVHRPVLSPRMLKSAVLTYN